MINDDEEYDPFKHREGPHFTSNKAALVNLIKAFLGIRVLQMPEAFMLAGLLNGIILTAVITTIATFSLHLLFRGMYTICKKKKICRIYYADAFKEALLVGPNFFRKFAFAAPYIVNFFISIYQLGLGVIFLTCVCSNIKQVVDINTDSKYHISSDNYAHIFLIPLLMLTYIRRIKYLVPISNIAIIVTLAGLVIIYYYYFRNPASINDRHLFSDLKHLPFFLGSCMFSVLAIGVIISVQYNMKYPEFWGGYFGILNKGMLFVTCLNIITGFGGYWRYGEDCLPSITLNLEIEEPLAWAVKIIFASALFLSIALQIYPVTEILWEQHIIFYMVTSEHKLFWEYVVRTCSVLFVVLCTTSIPHLTLFIAMFCSFCLSVVGLIIPPFLDLCLHYPTDFGSHKYILWRDIALILFGFLGITFSIYTSIYGSMYYKPNAL